MNGAVGVCKKRLIKALEDYDWRVGTGFLSTAFVMDVLTDINPEYAYKLLENEQNARMVIYAESGSDYRVGKLGKCGGARGGGIASLNHYSKGAVCEWLFDACCGINVGVKPNTFVIKPTAGGKLTYAKASYNSVYGLVESGWQRDGEKIVYTIKVPCNCTAEIILPNGTKQTCGACEYRL